MRPFLRTTDEIHLASRLRPVDGAPRAAVVVVHGFSASGNDPAVSRLADALHAVDLDVVTYDARGHGASGGECTLGDLERHDVAAAVELARRRASRVVLVGASMGAIAVLRHAAADPVDGVVAVSCPARWKLPKNARSVLAAGLTRTPPGRALASRLLRVRISPRWTNAAPPVALVPRVHAPLAFVHGADDRFIPASDAHELLAASCEPCRLDLVDGMGHAFDDAGLPAIESSVEWVLGSASDRP